MATSKKLPKPRNYAVISMMKRYHGGTIIKDRRQPRGGSRNKVRDYSSEIY